MFSNIVNIEMSDKFEMGTPVNAPTHGMPFSERPTDETCCPLCKRFPIRFSHKDNEGGTISVCTRCEHHVTEFGLDEDFYWGVKNITKGDSLNLRFDHLSSVREYKEKKVVGG